MKRIIIILLALVNITIFMYSDDTEIEAKSEITNVIVYPEWAYVTRRAVVNISSGETKIIFKNLPSWIDPESIQVKISNVNRFRILGTSTNSVYLKKINEIEIQEVKDKLDELNNLHEDLKTELNSLYEEKEYLNGLLKWEIEKIQNEKNTGKITNEQLEEAKTFIKDALLSINKRQLELNRKIKELLPEINIWKKKWQNIKAKANLEQKEIIIDINSQTGGQTELFVSYLISGASWYPKYNARIDADNNNVDIEYYAVIQQSTGEDWSNASFKLSTIKPYLIKQKPELNPWYVNSENISTVQGDFSRGKNDTYYNKLKKIQENQYEQMNMNEMLDTEAYDNYLQNQDKVLEVIKQAEERGTTVEFNITGKYNVKSDGKQVNMLVGNTTLIAEKQYTAIPVVSKSTYVQAEMRNESDFTFLPGVVKIYKSGNFIGNSTINFTSEKEKFNLYMGLEERIKVSRVLDSKNSSTTFFGNKKNLKVGYIIEVQNYLNDNIEIKITDQIPVSQNDKISIKLVNIEPKIEKTDNGILIWNIDLSSMEKKKLYFEFEIEYPSNIYLDNANELERQLLNM